MACHNDSISPHFKVLIWQIGNYFQSQLPFKKLHIVNNVLWDYDIQVTLAGFLYTWSFYFIYK